MTNRLCAILVCLPAILFSNNSDAELVPISNPNFEAQTTVDGDFVTSVQSWEGVMGNIGILNDPSDEFFGEAAEGQHKNILFLHNTAIVRQTLPNAALPTTKYTLSFDVGKRIDVEMLEYVVTVRAGKSVILRSANPVMPTQSGKFSRAKLEFSTNNDVDTEEALTLEIESFGKGQVYFDNFTLSYAMDSVQSGAHLKVPLGFAVVGYGHFDTKTSGQNECSISATLESENGLAYMTADTDNCHCQQGSSRVFTSQVHYADPAVNYGKIHRYFYQCVIKHRY